MGAELVAEAAHYGAAIMAGIGAALGYRHVRPNGLQAAITGLSRTVSDSDKREIERHRELMAVLVRIREDQLRQGR